MWICRVTITTAAVKKNNNELKNIFFTEYVGKVKVAKNGNTIIK